MTADEAIAAAERAFGERNVTICVTSGVLRVRSNTHETGCGFMIESGSPEHDALLVSQMLPQAVAAMDLCIANGKAPPRHAA
jgi:hypothetical protein